MLPTDVSADAGRMCAQAPALELLDVSGTKVTFDALLEIAKRCPSLNALYTDSCRDPSLPRGFRVDPLPRLKARLAAEGWTDGATSAPEGREGDGDDEAASGGADADPEYVDDSWANDGAEEVASGFAPRRRSARRVRFADNVEDVRPSTESTLSGPTEHGGGGGGGAGAGAGRGDAPLSGILVNANDVQHASSAPVPPRTSPARPQRRRRRRFAADDADEDPSDDSDYDPELGDSQFVMGTVASYSTLEIGDNLARRNGSRKRTRSGD